MKTPFTPAIIECKKEIEKLEKEFIENTNYRVESIENKIELKKATLSTLQMCEDKFLKFVEKLKSKFDNWECYEGYDKYSISEKEDIIEIIENLASQEDKT